MSYCRWSSNHGECDVYVYHNVSGAWTLHVAGRKPKHKVPDHIKNIYPSFSDPAMVPRVFADAYMAAHKAEEAWRRTLPGHEIKGHWFIDDDQYRSLLEIGPEAGQSYDFDGPGECAAFMKVLQNKGFMVPQCAIDALLEEQRDIDNEVILNE